MIHVDVDETEGNLKFEHCEFNLKLVGLNMSLSYSIWTHNLSSVCLWKWKQTVTDFESFNFQLAKKFVSGKD